MRRQVPFRVDDSNPNMYPRRNFPSCQFSRRHVPKTCTPNTISAIRPTRQLHVRATRPSRCFSADQITDTIRIKYLQLIDFSRGYGQTGTGIQATLWPPSMIHPICVDNRGFRWNPRGFVADSATQQTLEAIGAPPRTFFANKRLGNPSRAKFPCRRE